MREEYIRVSGFCFQQILTCEAVQQENEHGTVKVSGYVDAALAAAYVEEKSSYEWADITVALEDGREEIFFRGVVSEIMAAEDSGLFLLTLTLKTGTCLLDTAYHLRTYQPADIGYRDVLHSFTDTYESCAFIMQERTDVKITALIAQYKETDWTFAKRLASHFNARVIPECRRGGVKFFFGLPETKESVEISAQTQVLKKSVLEYMDKEDHKVPDLREKDSIYYIFTSREIYTLGSAVNYNGMALYIAKIESAFDGRELSHRYFLKTKSEFSAAKQYNVRFTGAALAARVTAVRRDLVQLAVLGDENAAAGYRWLPYTTVYSTSDGAGWYCMPEPGDEVRLYLPTEDEAKAYAASSTHLSAAAADERVNPDNKSIMNAEGKELLLTPSSLTFTNNDGMTIQLLDGEGIKIFSDKLIVIHAEENLTIASAEADIKIKGKEFAVFKQDKL